MIIEKQEADYNMLDWWKKVVFKNYANFEGRARRSELWYYRLFNILLIIGAGLIFYLMDEVLAANEIFSQVFLVLLGIAVLLLFIPSIAVAVRRLHDTGKSGWWWIIGIIPLVSYIGSIVLLVFYCTNGDRGTNQYGHDPKTAPNADEISQIGTE